MDKMEIIEAIKNMSVLELNELVKACEEEFGVSAAAGVVVAAADGGAAAEEEQTEFTVVLKEIGAEDVIVRSYNALAVNPDLLDCDYYRFKELDAGAVNAYECEYMVQYSWADFLFNDF